MFQAPDDLSMFLIGLGVGIVLTLATITLWRLLVADRSECKRIETVRKEQR